VEYCRRQKRENITMKILIAYGTANGCSRSVAERIQQRIAAANLGDITVQPVEKDKSKDAAKDFGKISQKTSKHSPLK
jgi:flavodoxin